MNILLVDDSRFLRLANERALVKAGHKVTSACDGEEALESARRQKPDLVILDMMLPKISGLEVLRALRKNPETAPLPVMVLTSLPQCNEVKLVSDGATAFFEKSRLKLDEDSVRLVQEVDRLLSRLAKATTASQ
jgi:CheY-like chemotaxis protein